MVALLFGGCQGQAGRDGQGPQTGSEVGETRGELTVGEDPAGPEAMVSGDPAADPLTGLDPRSRAALQQSQVTPLLLPEGHNASSTVTSGRGFFAVSGRDGEISLYLHATDVVHHAGDGMEFREREHEVRGQPALMLVNEGIRSLTWEEGRTSYVLEVECHRPFEDGRCTEGAFLLELAQQLVEVSR